MTIRPLTTLAECQQVEALQIETWGSVDVVPTHLLLAHARHGACLLGAYENDQLIGFTYAFRCPHYLYSHMSAVSTARRGQGLGLALKQAQKDWALEHGYERIVWTFDPFQSLNAHFNLVRVGAVAGRYFPDYYGQMEDEINRGRPSDRLEVDWWLRRARPAATTWVEASRETLQRAFAEGKIAVDYREGRYGLALLEIFGKI